MGYEMKLYLTIKTDMTMTVTEPDEISKLPEGMLLTKKTSFLKKEEYEYVEVENCKYHIEVAMVDLCKISGSVSSVIAKAIKEQKDKKTFNYIYSTDGNTLIYQDSYDDPLSEVNPKELLEALIKDNSGEPYRRYDMAIALIQAALGKFAESKTGDICVLTYGH